jgi:hypothetical protein
MHKIIIAGLVTVAASLVGLVAPGASEARGYSYGGPVHVSGYSRSSGASVAPHFRSVWRQDFCRLTTD